MKTILIAEDNDDLRGIVVDLLESEGFIIIPARDGQEAWDYLNSSKPFPDLIISDMMMPKMTGMELIENVRKSFPLLPCLVYSASPQFKGQCEKLRCHFVHKPFDLELLIELIHKTLEVPYETQSEARERGERTP